MGQSVGRFILVALLVLPFMSCGEDDSFNSDVNFSVTPKSPFIILNDTTIGTGDDTFEVPAPWFTAGFTIQNERTDYTLVVPSIRLEWSGINNGQTVTGEATLDADLACQPIDPLPGREIYAVIPPAPNGIHLGDEDCDGVVITDRALFFFGGLPQATSTSYFVTVTLEGFMQDDTDIDDPVKGRVRKIISFSTQ